jgi:predicted nucleotidyltransferase
MFQICLEKQPIGCYNSHMGKKKAFIAYPLDWMFSAPSHVALLRALKDSAEGMSGRAAARAAGINHQACRQALDRLEGIGIIVRQGSGHTQLLRLNFDHALVKEALLPLFRAEKNFQALLRSSIVHCLGKDARTATLFGSAARKEDRPGSDIDLLLVADGAKKTRLADKTMEFGRGFTKKYGIRLSPITYSASEAKVKYRSGDPLIKNILAHGIDLLNEKLKDVVI